MSGQIAESDELRRLRAWKQEAMTLFDGLQDLGRALDLPLGVLVTGPLAIEAANNLRADRDKYLAAFSEQFDQREEYAVECKRLWKQETRFEELADGYGHAGQVDIANAISEALRGDA